MYKIDPSHLNKTSAKQFCNQVYRGHVKPVLFWDTCAFLNIIRFIYREDPGDVTTFESIKKVYDAIMNDSVLSVSCVSVISEFNDHINDTVTEVKDSIAQTYLYFKNNTDVINVVDNTTRQYSDIRQSDLQVKLYQMVVDIMHKTKFINVDKTATSNAHQRVLQHKAPAGKKEEFKDCTIWEVMLSCYRQLNTVDVIHPKIFYTVNVQDFCHLVNKIPQGFLHDLVMEAASLNFKCSKTIFEVESALGI